MRKFLCTFLLSPIVLGATLSDLHLNTSSVSHDIAENKKVLGPLKAGTRYPEIPQLFLSPTQPRKIVRSETLSPGLSDPILQLAIERHVFDDNKTIIADARPRDLNEKEKGEVYQKALDARKDGEAAMLRVLVNGLYEHGNELESLTVDIKVPSLVRPKGVFTDEEWALVAPMREFVDKSWGKLLSLTPLESKGSILPEKFPILLAAADGRFSEAYYWDRYFSSLGLLKSGNILPVQWQVDDMLDDIRNYGREPNGNRDYYLSRSQPPFVSSLTLETYLASGDSPRAHTWLRDYAYPLLLRDYKNFWMNPERSQTENGMTRTHPYDDTNTPRVERYGKDDDRKLGNTYRDVKAACETGHDFTGAHLHEAARQSNLLINSLLYKTAFDLLKMAEMTGHKEDFSYLKEQISSRRKYINEILYDAKKGEYDDADFKTGKRTGILTANTFAPLFTGAATKKEAEAVVKTLGKLFQPGGIMASVLTDTPYQWDGYNGWPPHQLMAMSGLLKYGFKDEAKSLAKRWILANAHIYHDMKGLPERIDVRTAGFPKEDGSTRYLPQISTVAPFGWTAGGLVVAMQILEER